MKLDPFMDEYRSGTLATDDITEVRVYISSIWIYRRGLCTTTSYTTYISHNHKLQMCPNEESGDLLVTEQRSNIRTTNDITEIGVDILSQQIYRRDLQTSVCVNTYELHNTNTKCVQNRVLDLAKIELYCDCAEFVAYPFCCS